MISPASTTPLCILLSCTIKLLWKLGETYISWEPFLILVVPWAGPKFSIVRDTWWLLRLPLVCPFGKLISWSSVLSVETCLKPPPKPVTLQNWCLDSPAGNSLSNGVLPPGYCWAQAGKIVCCDNTLASLSSLSPGNTAA